MLCASCGNFPSSGGTHCRVCRSVSRLLGHLQFLRFAPYQEPAVLAALRGVIGTLNDLAEEGGVPPRPVGVNPQVPVSHSGGVAVGVAAVSPVPAAVPGGPPGHLDKAPAREPALPERTPPREVGPAEARAKSAPPPEPREEESSEEESEEEEKEEDRVEEPGRADRPAAKAKAAPARREPPASRVPEPAGPPPGYVEPNTGLGTLPPRPEGRHGTHSERSSGRGHERHHWRARGEGERHHRSRSREDRPNRRPRKKRNKGKGHRERGRAWRESNYTPARSSQWRPRHGWEEEGQELPPVWGGPRQPLEW